MDIQVSSNFERLHFDLSGRDGGAIAAMMGEFDAKRAMTIPADMRSGASGLFSSARIDGDAMALALRWAQEHGGQIIDRSEENTSELQSLMRTSYAVFCLN